jgi:hypothetical protein
MITDINIQHELLKTALDATDGYLGIEKKAKAAGMATNAMIHDFSYFMAQAHQALQSIGVLDQHQDYMEKHVEEMMRLHGHSNQSLSSLPYTHVPQADYGEVEEQAVWDKKSPVKKSETLSSSSKSKAKARAAAAGRPYPNMIDNMWAAKQQESKVLPFSSFITDEVVLTADELQQIVDEVEWEDIVDLYHDSEIEYEDVQEGLSAQARMRKKQSFARQKSKRNTAKGIKLKRSSTPEVLKKRAIVAARNALYKRLLMGRKKSELSAAEKTRIEQQVKSLKSVQASLISRMMPRMRSIEQKRLSHR